MPDIKTISLSREEAIWVEENISSFTAFVKEQIRKEQKRIEKKNGKSK